jgi:A/G-specific adenine glycosylase
MDLGATLCTPRDPQCGSCPWTDQCAARRQGIAGSLPRRAAKRKIETRRGTAFWVEHDGHVLLRRRPEKGLLGGMMEVPTVEPPLAANWAAVDGKVSHTFTHFHLELTVMKGVANDSLKLDDTFRWVRREELAGEALPTVMRKVVKLAGGG